jgi:hypothetical protein
MPRDDGNRGFDVSTPGHLLRRRFLQSVGAGVAVASVGTGSAASESPTFDGPFEHSYEAATFDPTTFDPVTSVFGEPDEGEGEEQSKETPKRAPEAEGTPGGGGGPVQQEASEGGLVETDFDALSALDVRGVVPSDAQVAAGPGALFEAINSRVAAYDKQGNKLTIRRSSGDDIEFEVTLDDWFQNVSPFIYEEGDPEREGDDDTSEFFEDYIVFDPRARFDPDMGENGRFLLACVDFALGGERAGRGAMLLSVSSSSDPTDPWYNYRIPPIPQQNGTRGLVDYPQLGYDGDAVYLTQNFFPGAFSQATMAALDKSDVVSGSTADATHFTDLRNPDGSLAFTVQPVAKDDGSSTGYFVNSKFFQGQTLTVWELTDPVGSPNLVNEAVRVEPYTNPPLANQPDTEEKIRMNDDRTRRVSWDGSHLWTGHTVNDGRARWYELDPDGPSVVSSGDWKRDGRATSFPTVESDANGEGVFVYNTSSGKGDGDDPGYANIEVAATAGNGVTAYETVKSGENDYDYVDPDEDDDGTQALRWGDYNGVSADPDEDGSFWVVSQYAKQVDLDPPLDEEFFEDNFYGTRIAKVSR